MPPKRVLIGFGADVDAAAGWLGSYGREDSPLDVSGVRLSVHSVELSTLVQRCMPGKWAFLDYSNYSRNMGSK